MRRPSPTAWLLVALFTVAAVSALDLRRVEGNTLVIYTTPALKDVLEKAIVPGFEAETGIHVKLVYLAAGDEYYRVLMSRDRPEADVFLHASPLYLEKGFAAGIFESHPGPPGTEQSDTPQRRAPDGGQIWTAFAQSPLVEVYTPALAAPPDLALTPMRFGLPHPLLSNNGVYAAMFFETLDKEAGQRAVEHTVVQPTNARANIGGVADGSFDVTLGYEAVASLYQKQGAKVAYTLPRIHGEDATTMVLFAAALVKNHPHPGGAQFIDHLFSASVQDQLASVMLRPTVPGHAGAGLDLTGARIIEYDWSMWADLESALPAYQVKA
ncbi:MAG: substrate-binding domain-containing protein [bacterium]